MSTVTSPDGMLYDAAICDGYQVGRSLPAGQWAAVTVPTLVMCGTEKESPSFFHNAATATAAALPNARLVVRRGLGHSKQLDAKAIAATICSPWSGAIARVAGRLIRAFRRRS